MGRRNVVAMMVLGTLGYSLLPASVQASHTVPPRFRVTRPIIGSVYGPGGVERSYNPSPGPAWPTIIADRRPFMVTAEATDDSGVAFVDFMLDGARVCRDNAPPYECAITFRGWHTLTAAAEDTASNRTVRYIPIIGVTVEASVRHVAAAT